MAIVKMKRLRLAVMAEERDRLLVGLQRLGCVELSETAPLLDDPAWAALARRDKSAAGPIREKLSRVNAALDTLQRYAPWKKGLLEPLPEMGVDELFSGPALESALTDAGRIGELAAKLESLSAEEGRIRAEMAALAPWKDTELPLDCKGTVRCDLLFLTAPAVWDLGELEKALGEKTPLAQLSRISLGREQQYLTLLVHKSARETALAALRPFSVLRAQLGDYSGSAQENLDALAAKLRQGEKEKQAAEETLSAMGPERAGLQRAADRLRQDLAREEARDKLLLTEKTLCLEGWAPEEKIPQLEALLQSCGAAWELSEPSPEEYPQVPVQLKNNKLTRCLNMVTEVYSLPAYGSVDPNPLMAPFFILFYGIMMADMGYGVLMTLFGLIALKKAKPRGGMRNFFELLSYCGVSTFLFGFITGGCFGNLVPLIVETVSPGTVFQWPWPILFTPLDDTIMILLGSLALGFVQIITGMIIGFIRKVKAGKALDAILDEGAWWVIYAGVILLVLDAGSVAGVPVVLLAGGLMLLVGSAREKKGFGKITGFFAAVYNGVTGIFSDVLSYSRLMALMLAGSVIAQVFNTIGAIPGNIFVLLAVSLVGNALNFALNLLGCFVHDLRLQCLEYFGKFYEDGGRAFSPLAIRTKYVNTEQE